MFDVDMKLFSCNVTLKGRKSNEAEKKKKKLRLEPSEPLINNTVRILLEASILKAGEEHGFYKRLIKLCEF